MKRKYPKHQNQFLVCACNNTEHQIVFMYDVYYPGVYMQVHLVKKPFWQRLIYGIKYIFGRTSQYGAFDEFVFHPDHSNQLLEVLDHLTDESLHSFSYH